MKNLSNVSRDIIKQACSKMEEAWQRREEGTRKGN